MRDLRAVREQWPGSSRSISATLRLTVWLMSLSWLVLLLLTPDRSYYLVGHAPGLPAEAGVKGFWISMMATSFVSLPVAAVLVNSTVRAILHALSALVWTFFAILTYLLSPLTPLWPTCLLMALMSWAFTFRGIWDDALLSVPDDRHATG